MSQGRRRIFYCERPVTREENVARNRSNAVRSDIDVTLKLVKSASSLVQLGLAEAESAFERGLGVNPSAK